MPLPASAADGSIFGNLFDDIKHIPERTIQQSRQLRIQQHLSAIQAQAAQDAHNQALVNDANQYGITPPKNPDGSVNYPAMAVAIQKAADMHSRLNAHLGRTDATADATTAAAASFGLPAPEAVPGFPGQNTQGATKATPPPSQGVDDFGMPVAPEPTAADELPLAARVRQATVAADLAKSKQGDQDRTDIMAKERATIRNEKDKDTYRGVFNRDPMPAELNPDGSLNASGLGALAAANNKRAAGYENDPEHPGQQRAIVGGPAWEKQKALDEKAQVGKDMQATKERTAFNARNDTLANISQAQANLEGGSSALGLDTRSGVLGSHLTGVNQGAADLKSSLDAIKSGLGIGSINEMRASSPTSSTGIGRIMEVEFNAFASAQRNLDQSQSHEQLAKNLEALKTSISNIQRLHQAQLAGETAAPSWYLQQSRAAKGLQAPAAPKPFKVLGITPVK